jgi:hypothetical protein
MCNLLICNDWSDSGRGLASAEASTSPWILIPQADEANLNWQPIGNQNASKMGKAENIKHKKIQPPLSDWIF